MRPYIAVIKDSFREAFASRVLWIVLILLGVFLLLIFPFSYSFSLTTEVSNGDLIKLKEIYQGFGKSFEKLEAEGAEDKKLTVLDELAGLINAESKEKIKKKLKDFGPAPGADDNQKKEDTPKKKEKQSFEEKMKGKIERVETLRDSLNQLIMEEDLTKLKTLDSDVLYPEAKALFNNPDLSEAEIQRFNRLIIEQTFEEEIRAGPASSIIFSYLGMEIPGKYAIEKERLFYILRTLIKYILSFVFSTVGILMALIITSNIIPQTFDPGSLNLLLSKPISRWKLFVAQFIGGCAFVTLTMTFFFVGIWFFLGSRMGYWNIRLLYYIPSFIGIFAVYYSASAVAGVIWRSSIVSVVAGSGLWLVTFMMYIVNMFCEVSYNSVAFRQLDVYGGQQVVSYSSDQMQMALWQDKDKDWKDVTDGIRSELGVILGPLYDESTGHVFGGRQSLVINPLGLPTGGKMVLHALDVTDKKGVFEKLDLGLNSIRQIYRRSDGRILVVSSGRLHLIEKAPEAAVPDNAEPGNAEPAKEGEKDNVPSKKFTTRNLGPRRSFRTGGTATAFAFNSSNDQFVLLRKGKVTVYAPNDEGQYEMASEKEFENLRNGQVKLAFGGNRILVFHSKVGYVSIDSSNLEQLSEFGDRARNMPIVMLSSRDGKWISVLKNNEMVWNYSTADNTFEKFGSLRDVKTITFDENSQLFVGDKWLRITQYDLETGAYVDRKRGKLSGFQSFYQTVIYPIYYISPKCGELNYTVEYLITGSETADTFGTVVIKFLNFDRIAPFPMETYNLNPWPQVWNALIFIMIMLGIGCAIIEWADF